MVLVRLMIGETFAFARLDGGDSTGFIIPAQRLTMIVAEVILGKVAMQVLLAAMLIDALHAALEETEIAFDRVGRYIATGIFLDGVFDRFVGGKVLSGTMIQVAFIGM